MKKILSILLILTMLLSAVTACLSVGAAEDTHLRTDLEEIEIGSYSELTEKLSANVAMKYVLTADIDFSGVTPSALSLYEGSVFDANGHSFVNLNAPSLAALFTIVRDADRDDTTAFYNLTVGSENAPAVVGQSVMLNNQQGLRVAFEGVSVYVSTKSETNNNHAAFCSGTTDGILRFVNCHATIVATDTSVSYGAAFGAFISRNRATATFENCTVDGDIVAVNNAGGFIGKNDGGKNIIFKNCTNRANVKSGQFTGGFVGLVEQKNNNLSFTSCQNNGTVTCTGTSNTQSAGGFVGGEQKFNLSGTQTAPNSTVSILYSTNKGDVVLTGKACAGGFVGKTWGEVIVQECVNYGSIGGELADRTAGFVVGDSATKKISVNKSLNAGDVISGTWAAGFIARSSDAYIAASINIGDITGDIWPSGGYVGGFVAGATVNRLSDSYSFGRILDKNDATHISYNFFGRSSTTLAEDQKKQNGNYCCTGGTYTDPTVPNSDGSEQVAYATPLQISLVAVKYLNDSSFGCLRFSYSSTEGRIVCDPVQGVGAVGWQMHTSGTALRVIGTVDSLEYDAIGFRYTVKDASGRELMSGDYTCSTVYSCILAGTVELRPVHFGGSYIYMLKFNNVEKGDVIDIIAFYKKNGATVLTNEASIEVTNTDPTLAERDGWKMSGFPAYTGGTLSGVYSQTVGYQTLVSNASNYSMQYATETTATEFNRYLNVLKSEYQFDVNVTSNTGNIIGAWVQNQAGAKLYTYFTASTGEARFILDRETLTAAELSDSYQKKAGDVAGVYLFGIAMDPDGENNTSLTVEHINPDNNGFNASNCGMSMIIKLYDNSVILIDGGGYVQMSEEAAGKLDAFLHDITDTPAGEKVRIRSWFLTHPHGDHYTGFIRFILNYHQNYELENVMYNLKNCPDDLKTLLGTYLPAYYPNITYHRPHTGESLSLGGVKLDVLFTFEDLISPDTLKYTSSDENDTSAVVKVTMEGKTVLITGDIHTGAAEVLLRNYTSGELKADVLQVPHHGLNPLYDFFTEVDPSVALFTQSKGGAQQALGSTTQAIYNAIKALVGESNMYFADGYYNANGTPTDAAHCGTTGVTVTGGTLTVTTYPQYSDHTPYPKDEASQWMQFDDFNGNEVQP